MYILVKNANQSARLFFILFSVYIIEYINISVNVTTKNLNIIQKQAFSNTNTCNIKA